MSDAGRVPVTFEPSGVVAWVDPGTTVLQAGRAAGVVISAPCGGRGVCGQCGVRVVAGELAPPTGDEAGALERSRSPLRLACRAKIAGPVTLRPVVVNSTAAGAAAALAGETPIVVGVDLGTTTVSATAVEQSSGRQLGTSVVVNRQQLYGADVLTRVSAALDGARDSLRGLAEDSVLDAVDTAAPRARARVSRLVIAGNVVMSTLLAGADVSSLASHPFSIPDGCASLPGDSRLLKALPNAVIELVPPLAGFVGGDVLAGLVAREVESDGPPRLLVDIGTNAEVALSVPGRVWVASAAAGPAFEGGNITCGGPATAEAVVSVDIADDGAVVLQTLGDAEPTWFSGAGLVSAVAAMRRAGHIDADGLMSPDGPLRARFDTDDRGILGVALGVPGGCLAVTQHDVRALQLAKAAVRVAIEMVLARAGVAAKDLGTLYVSGAFGGALPARDLVELGVVPVQAERVVAHAGNTSLAGATALAMDAALLTRAREVTANAVLVDLAADSGFSARLLQALTLAPYSA